MYVWAAAMHNGRHLQALLISVFSLPETLFSWLSNMSLLAYWRHPDVTGSGAGMGGSLMQKALGSMLQAGKQSSPLAGPAIADSIMAYMPSEATGMTGDFSDLGVRNDQRNPHLPMYGQLPHVPDSVAEDSLAREHCPDNSSLGHGLSSLVSEHATVGYAAIQKKAERSARHSQAPQLSAGHSEHMKDLSAAQQPCCNKADDGCIPGKSACTI